MPNSNFFATSSYINSRNTSLEMIVHLRTRRVYFPYLLLQLKPDVGFFLPSSIFCLSLYNNFNPKVCFVWSRLFSKRCI